MSGTGFLGEEDCASFSGCACPADIQPNPSAAHPNIQIGGDVDALYGGRKSGCCLKDGSEFCNTARECQWTAETNITFTWNAGASYGYYRWIGGSSPTQFDGATTSIPIGVGEPLEASCGGNKTLKIDWYDAEKTHIGGEEFVFSCTQCLSIQDPE